jgi:hypothetical protein
MKHLVIAAFWVDGADYDGSTKAMLEATDGVDHIPGSGAIVAIEEGNVDRNLRAVLRSVDLDEAADV